MLKLAFGTLISLWAVLSANSLLQPKVTITQGIVKGLYEQTLPPGREIAVFWGIPYAKPPTGKHRFKEAVAASPWIGEYNATRPPPACLQFSHMTYKTPFAIFGSEDCLYINVFTPKIPNGKSPGKLLDVIANIHGGAFMFYFGSGTLPHLLLNRDVVLVTFNYRLGPLGFLSTEDNVVPGNNGLKDQVLALKWIQENIAAFGGNPNSVTLTGLSAGSASVHYHILSPLSKGLFHGAILQSGVALNPWSYAEHPRDKALYIADQLGCPTNDSLLLVKCLRNRPADHIVGLVGDFLKFLYNPFSPFAPTVEPASPTAFISDSPINIIKQGLAQDVPMIMSYASEEGIYPGAEIVGVPENLKVMRDHWNELLPYVLDYYTLPQDKQLQISTKIKEHYKVDLNKTEGLHSFIRMASDRLFTEGIMKALRLHGEKNTSPIYVYKFSYRGTFSLTDLYTNIDLGVSHGDDVFYIFNTPFVNGFANEKEKLLSDKMIDLWATFAANKSLSSPWTPVQKGLPNISLVDILGPDNFKPISASNSLAEEEFWNNLAVDEILNGHPKIVHSEL